MQAARADICASLIPAEGREIAVLLESLSVMYPQQDRTEADDRIRARAWMTDLADYPADVIEAACVQWRRKDTPWMPTPGQLIALMDPIVKHRERLKRRADDLFAQPAPRTAKPEPVETAPDPRIAAEFDKLAASLSAKP